MEKVFWTTAIKQDDFYTEFGIDKKHSYIWGANPEDVVNIKMKVSDDQSEPDWNALDYWGWLPTGEKEFDLIEPNYKVLHVCFPYGIKAWEDEGIGKAYRLEIIEINEGKVNDN